MKPVQAIYEDGVLRPKKKLPFREHTKVTLVVHPIDPVSQTRGAFHVSKKLAQVLIYSDALFDA